MSLNIFEKRKLLKCLCVKLDKKLLVICLLIGLNLLVRLYDMMNVLLIVNKKIFDRI